jgi:hypothetical protein
MTATIICQITDEIGACEWRYRDVFGRSRVERQAVLPASSFNTLQPDTDSIPVKLTHSGDVIGHVHYLERGFVGTDLLAVGVVDADVEQLDGLYCSAEVRARMLDDFKATQSTLTGVAIVGATSGVAARPIVVLPGDFRRPQDRTSSAWRRAPVVVERAARAVPRHEWRTRPTRIHRPADTEQRTAPAATSTSRPDPRTLGPIEIRPARLLTVAGRPVHDLAPEDAQLELRMRTGAL